MTLQQILDIVGGAVGDNWGWILVALLSIVEVSKIKFNPWTILFEWIGNLFMSGVKKDIKDLNEKVTGVQSDIVEMKAESREAEAKAARNRILRFGDEVYQGIHHSKEYFDHILADISNYKKYCKEHPEFQNEMTVMTVQHIEAIYQRCLEEHDFL